MKRIAACLGFLLVCGRSPARDIDYLRDIKPLLAEKCSSCHGPIRQEAGLRLDAGKLVRRGGDSGEVIDLDHPLESPMLKRVRSDDLDERMPPIGEGEPLSIQQIQILSDWISQGAHSPSSESIPVGPEQHWAYQPITRPDIPRVAHGPWSDHPIDAFVSAKLKAEGLTPAAKADGRTLLRRLYLDLIGIPPTDQQQMEFLADHSDEAWRQVVDRLLADLAYGERWGRHWMDVWRYSDWDGYKNELRGSQRHIWRWRDWIIESLNADKGYDRMIIEMLAGDEVAPDDIDVLRATGFLARNFHNSNRNIWLDATVEHTAKAFLAMAVNCARCHDHKYDPIAQREYYALRAIFEPHNVRTERLPGESNLMKNGLARVFDAKLDEATYLFQGGNEKRPDKEDPLAPAAPSLFDLPFEPKPVHLPPLVMHPSLREFVHQEEIAASEASLRRFDEMLNQQTHDSAEPTESTHMLARQRLIEAKSKLVALKARYAADKVKYLGNAVAASLPDLTTTAAKAEHAVKIEYSRLVVLEKRLAVASERESDEKDQAKQQVAVEEADAQLSKTKMQLSELTRSKDKSGELTYTPVGKSHPATSTGRRLAFARWIIHPRNPLTARVAANHIWMRHFGQPLVENVFDFGSQSPKPSYAKLLDWLAVEFMENNWSMKHLYRLITTSRAYGTASSADAKLMGKNLQLDPENRLLWKANVRRLDAEIIRDSLWHVAGNLDLARGGPEIDFNRGETVTRRSLYFRHAYEKQMTMLVIFDVAGPTECYRRSPSIIPQQALALANSPLAIEQARQLAARLSEGGRDANAFIHVAFRTVLCRECSPEDLAACRAFLGTQTDRLKNTKGLTSLAGKAKSKTPAAKEPSQRARENLVHVLMNHNDFVTVR